MTHSSLTPRCDRPLGHADWASYLVGYLRVCSGTEVRNALIGALRGAEQFTGLPDWVSEVVEDLEDVRDGVATLPF